MFKKILIGLLASTIAYSSTSKPVKKYEIPFDNKVQNAGFEQGLRKWEFSGSTATLESASPMSGARSAKFTATGASQYIRSDAVAVPDALKGKNCFGKAVYKLSGVTAGVKFQIFDGTNILTEVDLTTQTDVTDVELSFICPTSGNILLRFIADGNMSSDILRIDDAYWGRNYKLEVGQAVHYGSFVYNFATNCSWSTSSAPFADFPLDSDCNSTTATGNLTAPATEQPGFRMSGGPGKYMVIASGAFNQFGTVGTQARFQIYDGTTEESITNIQNQNATYSQFVVMPPATFTYTTAFTDKFIRVRARTGAGSARILNEIVDRGNLTFNVYKFPLENSQVVKLEDAGWYIDANIGGANPSMAAPVSTYTDINNAGLDLVKNSGSVNVGVACSAPATEEQEVGDLTCTGAEGNESAGITFNLLRAGAYEACVYFTHKVDLNASANLSQTFQIVETPTNALTISQEGKTRIQSKAGVGAGTTISNTYPHSNCGLFVFSSVGTKVLRLMFESSASGTVTANDLLMDRAVSVGQRDMHWTVKPWNQNHTQPVIVNSVNSTYAGQLTLNSAHIAGASVTTFCSGSPCTVYNETGDWISSATRSATGNYTVNFQSGIYSSFINCQVSMGNLNAATRGECMINTITTSSANILCGNDAANVDSYWTITCTGD